MEWTIRQVVNELTSNPIENTVDTLKFGDENNKIKKIAICFMPTYEVIKQAIKQGVNLLICHEGVFFQHDGDQVVESGGVGQKKWKLIQSSGIAIYRLHDAIHHEYQPDGIMEGLLHHLDWMDDVEEHKEIATIIQIPKRKLSDVIDYVKHKLNLSTVRYVGDLSMNCSRIAMLVGYRGGGLTAIPAFEVDQVDLVIYGEGPEWETPEYIRDANNQGNRIGAIILGHLESEESGMRYLAKRIEKRFPTIPVEFIATEQCIKWK